MSTMIRHLIVPLLAASCAAPTSESPPPDNTPAPDWSAPVHLFDLDIRLAAGTELHAVGVSGTQLLHLRSADEGTTWTAPRVIPGAGALLIYSPLVAEGSRVYLLTRAAGSLQVQRSLNRGETWGAPVPLQGYNAGLASRIQMVADGDHVHVFLGRPGASGDPTFRVYYWRSSDAAQTFSPVAILDAGEPDFASPGGISAENGMVHIGYAALTDMGTLGHRARYLRSTDNGATWSAPVDISGPGTRPQIRPRSRVANGRVYVLWEEPLDHDQSRPVPNASRSEIRMTVSPDNGVSWLAPVAVATSTSGYLNHPEVAVGPASLFHVAYRISVDQSTLTPDDPMGYRLTVDGGSSWLAPEIAVKPPSPLNHPVNLVATSNYLHVATSNGGYARRRLP